MFGKTPSEWELTLQTMVADYEEVAQDLYRLDLSSPQDVPMHPLEFRQDATTKLNVVDAAFSDWKEHPFTGKPHDAVRHLASQRSAAFVSELLRLYLDLTPWLSGSSEHHRFDAIEGALVIRQQLTSWFLVLHDLQVIPSRDAPTLVTLIDRMADKSSVAMHTLRLTVDTWGRH